VSRIPADTEPADRRSYSMSLATQRQSLVEVFEEEFARTKRVLDAYPSGASELRPHERAKNARELAGVFPMELSLGMAAINGTMDLSGGYPPPPETLEAAVAAFEEAAGAFLETLRNSSDEQLGGTVRFFTGPQTMGDIPVTQFLWFLLHDQIHHRGQLSVYLRMSGAKVPSIYGPSADEPWF
jgi:uncharacterized damage-inducible protein DinB